ELQRAEPDLDDVVGLPPGREPALPAGRLDVDHQDVVEPLGHGRSSKFRSSKFQVSGPDRPRTREPGSPDPGSWSGELETWNLELETICLPAPPPPEASADGSADRRRPDPRPARRDGPGDRPGLPPPPGHRGRHPDRGP